MQRIIPPVKWEQVEAELTKENFVRQTNFSNREIYITSQQESPNVMRELGRLRELSFRAGGGGTGKSLDVDEYDTDPVQPFKQLVVWCPKDKKIIGGYRFLEGSLMRLKEDGQPQSPTSKLFHFQEKFIEEYLPVTIELGRSFIQPDYQFTSYSGRQGLYSLDNLWDGLGAVIAITPNVEHYFGKVTMFPRFNMTARDLVLHFIGKYFPDSEHLLFPHNPVKLSNNFDELEAVFTGENYKQNYRILSKKLREYKEVIPPLINAYMNLSPTMKTFGTAINHNFGNVEETGILITINDIYDAKKARHIQLPEK